MTFADSVLHLVRAGARIEPGEDRATEGATGARSSLPAVVPVEDAAPARASAVKSRMVEDAIREGSELDFEGGEALPEDEPGMADLEAAVVLVSEGLATRVTLSGFPSWPGLLWRAYQLTGGTDVLILPTVVRPGGRVDIVVTRDTAPHG